MTGRHVVFLDLDGTILDSSPGIVAGMREAFLAIGVEPPDDTVLRSWIGPPVAVTLERELGSRGADAVRVANRGFRAYFDEVGSRRSEPFDGMPHAMADLVGNGAVLVVVTHKPLSLSTAALVQHGLDHLVHAVHAPPSPAEYVPKDELFAHAIRGAKPRTAIAAGDRAGDVEAAAAHGVASIGVTWGFGSADELTRAGALALAGHPSELPSLLVPGGPAD